MNCISFPRLLLFLVMLMMSATTAFSQSSSTSCITADFSTEDNNWILTNGASRRSYPNPVNGCASDMGIVTPGVGGNNPALILTPERISNGGSLTVAFDIFRFNANLSCNSWSDYDCPTSMDLFFVVGSTTIPAVIDLLLPPGGPGNSPRVSTTVAFPASISPGTSYRIRVVFKPKSGTGNCNQPNSRYVLDNFFICPPINPIDAINDTYCDETNGSLVVNGNVASNDLSFAGANIVYSVVSAPIANGATSPGGATLVLNADGTFTITRTDLLRSVFTFTYRMTETTTGQSDLAQVVVCFSDAGPVPVQLSSFTASRTDAVVSLAWKTAHESNLTQFVVERNTGNGYLTIGTVNPMNAVNGSVYSYTDKQPSRLAASYRLRIVEQDGRFGFSLVKTIAALPETVLVYPNPSNGNAQVFIDAASSHIIDIIVFNQTGARVRHYAGFRNNTLFLKGLESGNYLIRVHNRSTGKTTVEKLTVL
ncbi:MAG: T9SS type A sorting domain-containing protein [Ferruginibacter sp.]